MRRRKRDASAHLRRRTHAPRFCPRILFRFAPFVDRARELTGGAWADTGCVEGVGTPADCESSAVSRDACLLNELGIVVGSFLLVQ
jgi:hypothetical protein